MRTRKRSAALLLCPLLLGVFALGCEPAAEEPQAMLLEDEQPPDNPDDAAIRDGGEVPIPTETSNLRADPEDPRSAAMLEDLEEREPSAKEGERLPLPEEPDPKKEGYRG